MNSRVILALIFLLTHAACAAQPTSIPEFVAPAEYAVYREVLVGSPDMWNIPVAVQKVVFFDYTFLRSDPDLVRALLQGKDSVTEQLIANFLEANKQPYHLEDQFNLGKPVVLVSQETAQNLVRGLDYAEQCYSAVQAVYPTPDYGGWYSVSRVGFDQPMKTALLYIEQSLCGGSGNFLVLKKESGVWQIKDWAIGLQSDRRLDSPID